MGNRQRPNNRFRLFWNRNFQNPRDSYFTSQKPFWMSADRVGASKMPLDVTFTNKSDNHLLSGRKSVGILCGQGVDQFPINRGRKKQQNDRKSVLFGYATHHMFLYGYVEKECSRTPSFQQCYLHTWAEDGKNEKKSNRNDSFAGISSIRTDSRSDSRKNTPFFL